jgi:hypothetical protein
MRVIDYRGAALLSAAFAFATYCPAQAPGAVAQACPAEFDQIYEWDDAGFAANGPRDMLLADGIANDPGPNAPAKGLRRTIVSGGNQIVEERVESWLIELDQEAMLAGRRPMSRAKKIVRWSYVAAIGDRIYREEKVTGRAPVREVKPRELGRDLPLARYAGSGPAQLKPGLANPGDPGFTVLGRSNLLGFACINQRWAPTGTGPGPKDERCLIDLPRSCSNAKRLDALAAETGMDDGRKTIVTHRGRTVELRLGALGKVVDKALIAPPPSFRGSVSASGDVRERPAPGLVCDCKNPRSICTPLQRRDCEQKAANSSP